MPEVKELDAQVEVMNEEQLPYWLYDNFQTALSFLSFIEENREELSNFSPKGAQLLENLQDTCAAYIYLYKNYYMITAEVH